MENKLPNIKKINEILDKTIKSITSSREEIHEVVDHSRNECKRLEDELNKLQSKTEKVIKEVDSLELEERRSRSYLSRVSKNFNTYTENDIREAYEIANEIRVRLILKREEERTLIERRKETEVRLKSACEVCKKAENIDKQISVATEYLMGNVDHIVGTVDDLSKRHFLGIKIIEAQEEERQRVARDIHDGPAQSMANIVVKTELCERLLEVDKDRTKEELGNLKTIVRGALKDIRKIIYDLRPMSLDDLGLVPTIERYVSIFKEDTHIDIELKILGSFNDMEPVIEVAIFRIIQESLNNIQKHSKATYVMISMEKTLTRLNISILDNGVGFCVDAVKNSTKTVSGGFGLMNIRERVELLNGKFQIKSSPGLGTKLSLFIPLSEEE
ncbi:sensor histidine kinase [Tissierella sp. MSJ-40]|uniref:histidine kinase n=1 Tax=Tissierella simiarum TaxID=2841534 RepID=A0ABS6E3S5_9FIRM|nr:sensor histidine kinase [Tissierella simiarum]MBU5437486.1 sensor histidine kinase [Tissierella simiarum]